MSLSRGSPFGLPSDLPHKMTAGGYSVYEVLKVVS